MPRFVLSVAVAAFLWAATAVAAPPDTVYYSKILIVPYSPMMHLSDADDAIAAYSQMTPAQVRNQFRTGLMTDLNATLLTRYQTYMLQGSAEGDEVHDLETIYGMVNYGLDTVYPVKYPVRNDTTPVLRKWFAKKQPVVATQYLNARLSHPELLGAYARKYGTDLFIFINQLEVVTHYKDCYDFALKTYRREFKVHYSVFDSSGRQVYGDVAAFNTSSGVNDVADLVREAFPSISGYVSTHLPPKELTPSAGSRSVADR
jgi:hypothetical protein